MLTAHTPRFPNDVHSNGTTAVTKAEGDALHLVSHSPDYWTATAYRDSARGYCVGVPVRRRVTGSNRARAIGSPVATFCRVADVRGILMTSSD